MSRVLGVFGACRKRETLTGDATIRYFDYLDGFDTFDGLLANLFSGDCWPAAWLAARLASVHWELSPCQQHIWLSTIKEHARSICSQPV